ncbi:putative sugar kinase YdjH [Posidoniimonas polymericola]|uniref:Putative sugar kinase YdjH n=1 Tax=Posidoniimonas polymericola TaxID=2528002 RepID=A0A5C5YRM5_9BACT|nr:PfkB family carbohydrate kinase [Posidoniimonas polymericola]TWT77377.1 putative sugar kinase YdjH [Posidoniimonas polymericola]
MPLLVVGSVAIDNVETPEGGRHDNLLGGSATHFSYAASFFTPVRLVGVVGEDWPAEHTVLLQSRNIDTTGLQQVAGGKTFTWTGRYEPNMNDRETLNVELNVFGEFNPVLPESYQEAKYVFLANGVPGVQQKVLDQTPGRRLAVADTMDLWIETQRRDLDALLGQLDGLVLNDSEAKLMTGTENLVKAGHLVREMGPKFVIIKKGEHGAMFFSEHETYVMPAFPTDKVVDPTGAGDSFAGGMMGYLAEQDNGFEPEQIKTAMAYGTLTASFNVEGFGLARMKEISRDDIEDRMTKFRKMLSF